MIRNIQISDIENITSIYNYYIENTVVTFEEAQFFPEEIKRRVDTIVEKYPWIVWEENNQVLGYAYASRFKERSAYKFSVESTIYLDHNFRGKKIGEKLYTNLLEKIKDQDFKVVYGGIALPNPASIKLHEKLGFKKVAHFSNVGYKFNKWIDVGYWELMLK